MTPADVKIRLLEVGNLATCCYLVHAADAAECAVIDPGAEADAIDAALRSEGLAPSVLLVTHSHFDHIGAVGRLHGLYPKAAVACSDICSARMQSPQENLGGLAGITVRAPAADCLLQDGDSVACGPLVFTALFVPGHAPGHMAFHCRDGQVIFCGDILFNGSLGRTDFPGCSYESLADSLRRKILVLPDETRVYPGHGPHTTIGREKRHNPFIRDLL